jgi:hypothetical protein
MKYDSFWGMEGPKSFVLNFEPISLEVLEFIGSKQKLTFSSFPIGEQFSEVSFKNTFNFYLNCKIDDFNDSIRDDAFWDTLMANGGVPLEEPTIDQLRVYIPSGGVGHAQAGYITKNTNNFLWGTASIDVAEHDNLEEMTLMICNSKTTDSDHILLITV